MSWIKSDGGLLINLDAISNISIDFHYAKDEKKYSSTLIIAKCIDGYNAVIYSTAFKSSEEEDEAVKRINECCDFIESEISTGKNLINVNEWILNRKKS